MTNNRSSQIWSTISSREVYKNPWIRVREDRIVHPNGKEGIYGVVEVPLGVYVIAINERSELLLIKQSHYPTGLDSWGLPAGAIKPGKTFQEQALEELQEEAGYFAQELIRIGMAQAQPGITSQIDHFFIAKQLHRKQLPNETDLRLEEGITEVGFFSFEDVDKMVSNGLITHGQTLSGLYLYQSWKNKSAF